MDNGGMRDDTTAKLRDRVAELERLLEGRFKLRTNDLMRSPLDVVEAVIADLLPAITEARAALKYSNAVERKIAIQKLDAVMKKFVPDFGERA